jgi:hypothetical protein
LSSVVLRAEENTNARSSAKEVEVALLAEENQVTMAELCTMELVQRA